MQPRLQAARGRPLGLSDAGLLDLACPGKGELLARRYPRGDKIVMACPEELEAAGLSKRDAVKLAAAFEYYRRSRAPVSGSVVASPAGAAEIIEDAFTGADNERVLALALDRASQVISLQVIAEGGLGRVQIDPKVLFGRLLRVGASSFVLAHNHPSGVAEPSMGDSAVTARVASGSALLDLDFLDHLVFGGGKWVSLRSRGELPEVEHMFEYIACSG